MTEPEFEMTTRVLASLAETADVLRPSERKVAEFVARDPLAATRMTISTLAGKAQVSEPTVVRFCRGLGYEGFIDFKLALAGDLAGGTPFVDQEIASNDRPDTVGAKTFGAAVKQLTRVRDTLDYSAMIRAAEAIERAGRIDVCGVAQSNFVASEMQHRLARMGFAAIAMADAHMQMQSVASLGTGDVALIMSFAGQSREPVTVANLARSTGATVIAITKADSALGRAGDIVINVDSDEQIFVYTSSATRFAHMLVVDILATLLALRGGQPMLERLRRSRLATRDFWIPEDEPSASSRPDFDAAAQHPLTPENNHA